MRFVMNERKFAEEILNGDNLGDGVWYTLSVLAKYFYGQGMSKKEIKAKLSSLISERMPMVSLRACLVSLQQWKKEV